MNRFNYIGMLAYVALSMSSCDDSFDVSSKADGVLAVSQEGFNTCLLYTSPSPRDVEESRMPSSA